MNKKAMKKNSQQAAIEKIITEAANRRYNIAISLTDEAFKKVMRANKISEERIEKILFEVYDYLNGKEVTVNGKNIPNLQRRSRKIIDSSTIDLFNVKQDNYLKDINEKILCEIASAIKEEKDSIEIYIERR